MHADFEDTVTARPSLPSTLLEEPDGSDTVISRTAPPVLIEPAVPVVPVLPQAGRPLPTDRTPAAIQPPTAPVAAQFYGFRVGASAVVILDAIVYVGRRPSVPRVVRGGLPRLVRVTSPTSEVSGTHLELRQQGRTVVVTDMRSTNGTTIGLPGLPVRRLRQGESVVVTPGTLIDIGDRNVIEILPLQERR